jgi:hypothetical protein
MVHPIISDGHFYSTYKSANPDFSPKTFACAEDTVAKLLNTATTSEHPGMLLGKVQSGKTRTFISILACAFDNSFDIAVVLSKNSRALIEQTSKRLNSEFTQFVKDGDLEIYDIMHAPAKFTAFELESKLIFVSKKQTDNLRRLMNLFEAIPLMKKKRVLIVDDEADNASVGYTKKGEIYNARTIARNVSELRAVIDSSSFLQVTATPYSLYLQPADAKPSNVPEFKPVRPAFTTLVPVPADYVGGDTYFGELAKSETDTLESLIHHTVEHNEFERLKKQDNRSFKLPDVLKASAIEGYRLAIVTFIVGGCIQRLNGIAAGASGKSLRYSFLLHSEAARGSHRWQGKLTEAIITSLYEHAMSGSPRFEELVLLAFQDLSKSLRLAGQPVPAEEDVLDAVREALSGGHITIAVVNSDDDVSSLLDDSGQLKLRTPLNIFIGGQVLDRGVTLANLIGFYYGRRPNKYQQDTVLQHSRMYGFRRNDLSVTRFYTSSAIRFVMSQMEEFDVSLRSAIEAGGDHAVQFIRMATNGKIVPCSPGKILIATTKTLKPHKRILPIGFKTGRKTGAHGIGKRVLALDKKIDELCGFNTDTPATISLIKALELLDDVRPTLEFPEDAPHFDWNTAKATLIHLSQQHPDPAQRGNVLLWAAKDRNSARMASSSSHATFIETPDSQKTEGLIAKKFAIEHPILFMLRQNGSKEKGWQGAEFYWPVIRAQANTPTAIYAAETID